MAWKVDLELDSDFSNLSVAMGKVRPSLGLGHLAFFLSDFGCSLRSLAHPTHILYKLYPNTLKTASLKLSDTD